MALVSDEMIELSVCSDCQALLANGEVGGMDDIDGEVTYAIAMAIDETFPAEFWNLLFGGTELGFSWQPCETCSSPLAGDRFRIFGSMRGL